MFNRTKVFGLLLLIASITMLLCFWAEPSSNTGSSENFLDGCDHVYLDMGTNTGVQIRKLYEPHLFANSSVLPIFDKFFGQEGERNLTTICAVGFEPNIIHNEVLHRLEEQYQACGWRVYINLATGVGKANKQNLEFAHKKVWQGGCYSPDGVKTLCNTGGGWAWTDPLGVGGRILDDGNYAEESKSSNTHQKISFSKVRQIRIAEFITKVVATRRFQRDATSPFRFPPSVVMKLDVEGRELDVIPDLVMSGALQHIDHLHVDWTRDEWTKNVSLVEQLSDAMRILTSIAKDRGLAHTTEVVALDDESYKDYNGPLPQCKAPTFPPV